MLHAFLWFIGVSPTPDGTSPMYQLWSGIIPALAILGGIGAVVRWVWGHTCHVKGCWRPGRYEAGPYKVCWKHHPSDDPPERSVTPEHVRAAWRADLQRLPLQVLRPKDRP